MPGVNGVRDGGDLTMLNGLLSREGWQILHPRDHNYINIHNAIAELLSIIQNKGPNIR